MWCLSLRRPFAAIKAAAILPVWDCLLVRSPLFILLYQYRVSFSVTDIHLCWGKMTFNSSCIELLPTWETQWINVGHSSNIAWRGGTKFRKKKELAYRFLLILCQWSATLSFSVILLISLLESAIFHLINTSYDACCSQRLCMTWLHSQYTYSICH